MCIRDSDYTKDSLTILYKTVGHGTEAMSKLPAGATLDILTGLGNGFDVSKCKGTPLLVGGGAGIPPLFHLAKRFLEKGVKPTVILGFNTADEVFYEEEFRALEMCIRDRAHTAVKSFAACG